MTFRDPWVLLFIPVLFVLMAAKNRIRRESGFYFPADLIIKRLKGSFRLFLQKSLFLVRFFAISLVLVALARPQVSGETRVRKEGIAIMLAIDCSSTMLAEDLKLGLADLVRLESIRKGAKAINRITAAREVAREFVRERPDDLIGLVAFAARAFIACPLTFDHEWLERSLDRMEVGLIRDGTAIGSGILSALNSLKDVKAKSRIVILLTDGVNNFGQITPMTAAKAARAMGIKIYTVGIVANGEVPFPVKDEYGRELRKQVYIEINENVLKEIAATTGGDYLRADSMDSLRENYQKINRLEKIGIEEKGFEDYQDVFYYFLIVALFLVCMDIFLSNTFLRKIP